MPSIAQKDEAAEGQLAFDATFEVYPEVKIADLAEAEIERVAADVSDEAIDKTRRDPAQAAPLVRPAWRTTAVAARRRPHDHRLRRQDRRRALRRAARPTTFQFLRGRRPDARGIRKGRARHEGRRQPKTFPLSFPADYHGKDVAGKEADFLVTLKKIEAQHLPEVNESARQGRWASPKARSKALRADIKKQPRARSEVPRAGPEQGRRDGRAGRQGRAGPAQRQLIAGEAERMVAKAPAPT